MNSTFDSVGFHRRLSAGLHALSGRTGGCDLLSLTFEVEDLGFAGLPRLDEPYVYASRPDQGEFQLGLGRAWSDCASGGGRFSSLNAALKHLAPRWRRFAEGGEPSSGPPLFCALAFDGDDPMNAVWQGLPNSLLLLPRLLLSREQGRTSLTFSCEGEAVRRPDSVLADWSGLLQRLYAALLASETSPASALPGLEHGSRNTADSRPDSEPEAWCGMVRGALREIAAGRLDKVVVARSLELVAPQPIETAAVLAALTRLYPSCRLLAVNLGGNTVVSASPEGLAAVRGNVIRCDALGGTGERSSNPRLDRGLSAALMKGSKARHEHALVVASIRGALQPLCETLMVPTAPTVAKLRNLQHLKTVVNGRLRGGTTLLDAAQRLHPTSAVAGTPRSAARRWLRQYEGLQRGWYSGAFGWLHAEGDGDLSVVLRCAVLRGRRAELFAGAGIVAGSDPEAELRETEIKMQAMLEAMGESASVAPQRSRAVVGRR